MPVKGGFSVRRFSFFCLLFSLLFLAGCTMAPKQKILADYVNQDMIGIARVEQTALDRYASVTGKNYTSLDHVYRALDRTVIPTYGRFYHLLENIRPDDDEVMRVHTLYVRGAREALEGFKLKKYGIETRDLNLILLGNQKIDDGLAQSVKWGEGIKHLRKDRGLKTPEELDSWYEKAILYINDKLLEVPQPR